MASRRLGVVGPDGGLGFQRIPEAPPAFRVAVVGQFIFGMIGDTLYACRLSRGSRWERR